MYFVHAVPNKSVGTYCTQIHVPTVDCRYKKQTKSREIIKKEKERRNEIFQKEKDLFNFPAQLTTLHT